MSVRLSSLRFCLCVAVFALGGLLVCSAQVGGKQRGRSIEFSAPRSDEVTTNLHQLTSRKDGLKQLEEDLYAPLQSFAPRSSLEGVVAPPPRAPAPSAIQSKRVRELLERRKNWVFMTPEDLLAAPTVEQILKTPEYGADGQEKKNAGTFEGYYQRVTPKRSTRNNPGQLKDEDYFSVTKKSSSGDMSSPGRDDANLPSGVRESADALKTMLQSEESSSPFARGATLNGFSDPFRVGARTPSKEQILEHKKLMDEYHSLVDPSWHPPVAANPFNLPLGDAAQSAAKPSSGLPVAFSSTSHKGLDAQMDITHPLLGPAGLPDVNAQALGQSRSASALPKVQETRVTPPAPSFTAPKRAF